MAAKIYYQEDCNLSLLEGQKIAIIGYGSQGHAHALNLKESGCDVIIGSLLDAVFHAQAAVLVGDQLDEHHHLRKKGVGHGVLVVQLPLVLHPEP